MPELLPARVDLTLYRGDTRIWTDTVERNVGTDLAPIWEPYDFTGHELEAEIRADKNRGDLIATIEVTATDAANGDLRFYLSPAEADKLGEDGSRYYWDFQVTRTSDGFRRTHFAGAVKVKGDSSNG